MTDQEYVDRLLELSAEFTKLLTADEGLAARIPPGKERSLSMIIVHVDGLVPATSRLINPHLETASL